MLVTVTEVNPKEKAGPTLRLGRSFLLLALLLAAGFLSAQAQTVSPDFFFWPADIDGDAVPNTADNCPTVYNPTQAQAGGGRGGGGRFNRGELCDNSPPLTADYDADGISNLLDNCPNEGLQENGSVGFVPGPCPGGAQACTYNPLQEDYNQDGIGNKCSPLSTKWKFCVNGPGTGVGWTYGFDSSPYPASVPVTGITGTASDLAQKFVDSINGLGAPLVATRTGPCFEVQTSTYPGGTPFDFRIIPPTGDPCSVPGNPIGCSFNPMITNYLASPRGAVPALTEAGLAALTLALVLAGAWLILLRRRRVARAD